MSCFSPAKLLLSSSTSCTRMVFSLKLQSIPKQYMISDTTKQLEEPRQYKIPNTTKQSEEPRRRSANYHPTIWDHWTIQSIKSPYSLIGNTLEGRRQLLQLEVKQLLDASNDPLAQLQLIDSIQRLGVAYHFDNEIKYILDRVHNRHGDLPAFDSLNKTSLAFRLLREHGYDVSSDIFQKYRDSQGFKDSLTHDVKGLMSLYETSFLSFPGEQVLEEANEFTIRHLENLTEKLGSDIEEQVRHSLQVPLHRRMRRLEARDYLDVYQREEGRSSILLEFAKVDFNFVQTMHQEELKELSKIGVTKMICILTIIDDVYDIYGFFEEVKIFTKTIKSWDPQEMVTLPENFKLCYLLLHNSIEEICADILLDHGCDITHFLKKEWEILCGAYLLEAEWFNEGYYPSLKEYLKNAWISIGGSIAMVYTYSLQCHKMGNNSLNYLKQDFSLIYWSSQITRLNDDLATSKAEMERGDTPKSIQCHMHETNESEQVSRKYIRNLVDHFWKELNQECKISHLPRNYINMVINMARASHSIFQFGDGVGDSIGLTKNRILSLLVNHVPLE